MTIYEYINKNLPNLNWNILPQIFESEGVELTEDIEKYLRETPGNTNWNVIKDLNNSNKDNGIKTIYIAEEWEDWTETEVSIEPNSDLLTPQEIWNWCNQNVDNMDEKIVIYGLNEYEQHTYHYVRTLDGGYLFEQIEAYTYQIRIYEDRIVSFYENE